MTDRELRKLRRSELLEMMIAQKKTVAAAKQEVEEEQAKRAEVEAQLAELKETYERLRKKLDAKDEKIKELQAEVEHQSGKTSAIEARMAMLDKVTAETEKAAEMYLKVTQMLVDRYKQGQSNG